MTTATAEARPSAIEALKDPRRWRFALLVAVPTIVVCLLFNHFFYFGRDMQVSGKRSTTNVLYLIPRHYVEPEIGDWIAFRAARMVAPFHDGMTVVKRLVAGPGDHVKLTLEGLWVNGQLIEHNAVTHMGDEAGTPVDLQPLDLTLPEGRYFVVGTHPRSYDSRFWGLLESERVISKAYGLF